MSDSKIYLSENIPVNTDNPFPVTSSPQNPVSINDWDLEYASQASSTRKVFKKFGHNPGVGQTLEDIWSVGGLYTGWLTSADTVRVAAGGSADDTAAGTGARSIVVSGLDSNWDEVTETITTNGTSAGPSGTTNFIRVNRAWVLDCGTYGISNADDVVIETTGGITVASIEASNGQTQMAMTTIPNNYEAYVTRTAASVSRDKSADVLFYQRRDADIVTAPFRGRRVFHEITLSGISNAIFRSYIGPIPGKTDLWVAAEMESNVPSAIRCEMDILLCKLS